LKGKFGRISKGTNPTLVLRAGRKNEHFLSGYYAEDRSTKRKHPGQKPQIINHCWS